MTRSTLPLAYSRPCKSDGLWDLDEVPKRIYVAASMNAQLEALRVALLLTQRGFEVTSRWITRNFSNGPDPDREFMAWCAREVEMGRHDIEDLEKADTLIVLADVPSSSGGYHVELGYFLGRGRTNIIVTRRPTVFYWLPPVRVAPVMDDKFMNWLVSQKEKDSARRK